MEIAWIVTGSVGLAFSLRQGHRIDFWQQRTLAYICELLRRNRDFQENIVPDLPVIARLNASIRAGQSLESALENISEATNTDATVKMRLKKVLCGQAEADFFSQFLSGAIQSGAPILNSLLSLQRLLLTEKRMRLRVVGLSGQARAQAEVLTWLPWVLAAGLAIVDPEWVKSAMVSSVTWVIWAASLALCGLGRTWICHSMRKTLQPDSEEDALLERDLPELALRMSTEISLGRDPQLSLQNILAGHSNPHFRNWLCGISADAPAQAMQLRALIEFAGASGAPLRQELEHFLMELYAVQESRWEERVQRLPVRMLAPLFGCFFPASLLILIGLLLPSLKDAL